jgi:hypothetical protein
MTKPIDGVKQRWIESYETLIGRPASSNWPLRFCCAARASSRRAYYRQNMCTWCYTQYEQHSLTLISTQRMTWWKWSAWFATQEIIIPINTATDKKDSYRQNQLEHFRCRSNTSVKHWKQACTSPGQTQILCIAQFQDQLEVAPAPQAQMAQTPAIHHLVT